MAKMNRKDYARQTEREMRDQMNGVTRDASGKMTHIYGRPIAPLRALEDTRNLNVLREQRGW